LSRIHCCSGTVLEFGCTQAAVRSGKGRIEAREPIRKQKNDQAAARGAVPWGQRSGWPYNVND